MLCDSIEARVFETRVCRKRRCPLRRVTWTIVGLWMMLAAGMPPASQAQTVGRIEGPGATRLEIAVSPLADSGGAAQQASQFSEVLSRNLTLSGYFRVLDK